MFGRSKGDELMVVVACVAIGLAILVPKLIKARQDGQLVACKSNLLKLAKASEAWASDHGGLYPRRLEELADLWSDGQGGSLLDLPECPRFPEEEGGNYLFRVFPPTAETPFEVYTITCPDGTPHGLPDDEPRYEFAEGLICGAPHRIAGFRGFLQDLPYIVVTGLGLLFFVGSLARRPDPSFRAQTAMDRSRLLSLLSGFSWFLLVSGSAGVILWLTRSWPFLPLRILMASVVCGLLAELVVLAGYRLWEIASPTDTSPPEGQSPDEQPSLGSLRACVVPGSRDRIRATVCGFALPLLTLVTAVGLPALQDDSLHALQGSLIGLAAAALMSFLLYLWGKAWARTFSQCQLEWVPGTDLLLVHSWNGARVRTLGTVDDIESLRKNEGGYVLKLAGEIFQLPPGELGRELAAAHDS